LKTLTSDDDDSYDDSEFDEDSNVHQGNCGTSSCQSRQHQTHHKQRAPVVPTAMTTSTAVDVGEVAVESEDSVRQPNILHRQVDDKVESQTQIVQPVKPELFKAKDSLASKDNPPEGETQTNTTRSYFGQVGLLRPMSLLDLSTDDDNDVSKHGELK
jgi:hypothetical protein